MRGNSLQNHLLCVEWDVKTHSLVTSTWLANNRHYRYLFVNENFSLKYQILYTYSTYIRRPAYGEAKVWVYSRSIRFFSWCLSHWPVGDSGQPVRVRRQFQQTEASWINAWRSARRVLSVAYNIKNVLISTVSIISSGRSLSLCNKNNTKSLWLFMVSKICMLPLHQRPISFFGWYLSQAPVDDCVQQVNEQWRI